MFTVNEVARRYLVSPNTVLTWLADGSLKGVRVNRKLNAKKPHWRITQAALDNFEQLRTTTPPLPRTRRRKRPTGEFIEFIK